MKDLKQININDIECKEQFELSKNIIDKIICNLDDLEDYYYTLSFVENYRETKQEKEWWIQKIKEIEEEYTNKNDEEKRNEK